MQLLFWPMTALRLCPDTTSRGVGFGSHASITHGMQIPTALVVALVHLESTVPSHVSSTFLWPWHWSGRSSGAPFQASRNIHILCNSQKLFTFSHASILHLRQALGQFSEILLVKVPHRLSSNRQYKRQLQQQDRTCLLADHKAKQKSRLSDSNPSCAKLHGPGRSGQGASPNASPGIFNIVTT